MSKQKGENVCHFGGPMIDHQMINWILSLKEIPFLMLSWSVLYVNGLWDDDAREYLSKISSNAEKGLTFPWNQILSENEWFPARVRALGCDYVNKLRILYQHWFKLIFRNEYYVLKKDLRKGLILIRSNRPGGNVRASKIFDIENPGFLFAINRTIYKKLFEEMGFDSFVEEVKDSCNTVKGQLHVLFGPISLVSHSENENNTSIAVVQSDSSRSLLLDIEYNQFNYDVRHKTDVINSWLPLKVSEHIIDKAANRLTQEEIELCRSVADRDYKYETWPVENTNNDQLIYVASIMKREVVRGCTLFMPRNETEFGPNEEITTFKYSDRQELFKGNKRQRGI